MDTPACAQPQCSEEQQILDGLVLLRDKLLLLKRDHSTYIKSQDVLNIYDELIGLVRQLGEVRSAQTLGTEETQRECVPGYLILCGCMDRLTESRLVERVLESCFQLISLAFMTTGRNDEAPAAFALTSTIRRLLDHLMTRKSMCSLTDLDRLAEALDRLSQIVHQQTKRTDEGEACQRSSYVTALLRSRIEKQQDDLEVLRKGLERYQGDLAGVHEQLISILRGLVSENTRSRVGLLCGERERLGEGIIADECAVLRKACCETVC